MDEQIKPVAWAAGDKVFDDSRRAFQWSKTFGYGNEPVALYSQQSIDALRAELAEQCRLHAIGMERELALIGRADRAEAEAKALREDGERYRWLRPTR